MSRITLVLALAASLLLTACGSSTPSASTAPDGAATCTNAATLKSSVATLDAVDLATVSSADLKAAIDGVAAATDQLIEGAQAVIAQQLTDLEGAVNELEAAYVEASSGAIADASVQLKSAIADVDAAAAIIETELKPTCP
jgi:hypothetical protein